LEKAALSRCSDNKEKIVRFKREEGRRTTTTYPRGKAPYLEEKKKGLSLLGFFCGGTLIHPGKGGKEEYF